MFLLSTIHNHMGVVAGVPLKSNSVAAYPASTNLKVVNALDVLGVSMSVPDYSYFCVYPHTP